MEPYETNESLVDAVARKADDYRILDRGPAGRPVVAAEIGGNREPTIMLTAGAHATEQAGVAAAVELLDRLETDHRVFVIPTRDPIGVDGFATALETTLGEPASVESYDELEALLRAEANLVVDDDVLVGLIGEYGFGMARPTADTSGSRRVSNALLDLEGEAEMEALRGRRIFLLSGHPAVEGTGDFDRLYTRVITPSGENLHLNRFIGSRWAPPESSAVRELADAVEPGLFVDLHEYSGDGYWVSTRPKTDRAVERREREIGQAVTETVTKAGGSLLPLGEYIDEDPDDHFFTELTTGLWDLDYRSRGEGFNATDYVAEHYGLAFTNETGMYRPFDERVEMAVQSVTRAVAEFERQQE